MISERVENEYDAFISYSRCDVSFARLLEENLSNYKPPKIKALPQRRLKVFRDESDLCGPDYFEAIDKYLNNARKLILICSPDARKSEFVNDEIKRFLKSKKAEDIISVIITGLPENEITPETEKENAFPPALTQALVMPYVKDYRGFKRKRSKLDKGQFESTWYALLAELLGIERAEIEQREKKRDQRKLRIITISLSCIIIILSALTGYAFLQKYEATRQARIATSHSLAANSRLAFSDNKLDMAVALAVQAHRVANTGQSFQSLMDTAFMVPGTRRLFAGHTDRVTGIAVKTDGLTFISSSADDTLRCWDLPSGNTTLIFKGHTDDVNCLALTPDEHYMVSGGSDKTLIVWDVQTGEEIRRFTGHSDKVTCVAIFPDGRKFLSGSGNGELKLWDVEKGEYTNSLNGHSRTINQVAIDPAGRFAASASDDDRLCIWDMEAGGKMTDAKRIGSWGLKSVVYTPKGKSLLVGRGGFPNDENLLLCDVDINGKIRVGQSFKGAARNAVAAVSEDERFVLMGTDDMNPSLWDIGAMRIRDYKGGHTGFITSVAFMPDGQTILTGSTDNTIRMWDIKSGPEKKLMAGKSGGTVFGPDGRTIAGPMNNHVRITAVDTGERIRLFTANKHAVEGIAFSPDGKTLISGSRDKSIHLWSIAKGNLIKRFMGHTATVECVVFSPDGKTILSGSGDKTLILWDIETGAPVQIFKGHEKGVQSVAFSPDGKTVLSGSEDFKVFLWDIKKSSPIQQFTGHDGIVYSVDYHPHAALVVSGSDDGTIRIWDRNTSREMKALTKHSGSVYGVTFSPDGRYILSGSRDRTMRLWDVATGEEIRRFSGHGDIIRYVDFGPDGHTVLSNSWDGTTRLWNIDFPVDLLGWTQKHRHIRELTSNEKIFYLGKETITK